MRTLVKVLLGIAGAIVLLIAVALYFTSGLTKAGDEFFTAVASGNMGEAYGALSSAFRADASEEELAAYLAANRMDKVIETSWSNRSADGGVGKLVGTLTTAESESIPVQIDLIKEEGAWKIYALRRAIGTAGLGGAPNGLPEEDEQVALVVESMGAFVNAVAAQDMTGLHDHMSRLGAAQFDVASLENAFKPFYKFGSNLQVINTLAPVFDGHAKLSDEGIMEVKGYYPTSPNHFHFDLKYVYEGTGWKLMGLSAEVK